LPKPLSVYMFTDTFGHGGAQQVLLTLIDGLDRRRWRPTLVFHDTPGIASLTSRAKEMQAELWPVPRMPEGAAGAARVPRFAAALRARGPAVFHAHLNWQLSCKFGLFAAVLARVPAIVATEHLFVEFPLSFGARVQQQLLASRVGRYVAVSRHVERRLHEILQIPGSKLAVVPNGIDTRRLQCEPNPDLRAHLSRNGTRPVVLTMARLVEEKGIAFLLEATRSLPDVQVVIAGDGPQRDALERQARALGVGGRVVFLGRRSDVPQLLACSDIVVLPSLNEGLPLAVLEAMAAGKPVVATIVGGTDELIADGQTGLLVPPRDPPALAAAVRSLAENPKLASAIAAAGRRHVEQSFSATAMLERVTTIYEELLSARGALM
jgi:glycosyltransferase involved in cell wall biosynthesis